MFRYRIGCVLQAKKAVVSARRVGYASKRQLLDMSRALEQAFPRLKLARTNAVHHISKGLSQIRGWNLHHAGKPCEESRLQRDTRSIDRPYDTS